MRVASHKVGMAEAKVGGAAALPPEQETAPLVAMCFIKLIFSGGGCFYR